MSRPRVAALLLSLAACAPVEEPFVRRVVEQVDQTPCAPTASRRPGEHCSCLNECDERAFCRQEELYGDPRGTCAASCANGLTCAPGFTCSNDFCYAQCEATADCEAEALCLLGACIPFCDEDADCLSGTCNRHRGRCVPPGQPLVGGGLEAPCATETDCLSNACIDGRCATACSVAVGACPDDGVCARVRGDTGVCYQSCTPGESCAFPDRRCSVLFPGLPPACLPTSAAGCLGKTASPTAGNNCGCDADCDVGTSCARESSTGFPRGLCLATCNTDADCPATHGCRANVCYRRCATDDSCGVGQLCGYSMCVPFCVLDSECLSGTCDRYTNRCTPPAHGGAGPGATCASNAACASDRCDRSEHPDGMCATYCSRERGSCPDQAVCVGYPNTDSGQCFKTCNTAADCPQAGGTCWTDAESGARFCN